MTNSITRCCKGVGKGSSVGEVNHVQYDAYGVHSTEYRMGNIKTSALPRIPSPGSMLLDRHMCVCVCVCACNPFLFSSHSHTTCASLAGLCDYVLNCVAFVSWQQSPSNDANIYLLLAFLFCLFA